MKCLLYIPPFECEGTRVSNIADVRVGGISLYQRACRSIQKAGFEEIIVARPDSVQIKPDFQIIKIPIQLHEYKARLSEITQPLLEALKDEDENQSTCICVLDGMLSPECLGMRPVGADVRILTKAEPTGVYFVSYKLLRQLLDSEDILEEIEADITETFQAPDNAIYHRMLCSDDAKIAQNMLTKSLRKPFGRDADGLIAYTINRPCSLFISKRIANSFITPNMVTVFGLILGLVAAGLMFTAIDFLMILAVILWQISSMVDGIDGELARMRMNPSHKGEWFDTVADDITNITFMFGLGHAMSIIKDCPLYFYIASGVCVLMVIACLWFYREFVKMGIASHNHFEWGFEAENKENKRKEHRNIFRRFVDLVAGGFAWIAKRDFYTFLIMILVIIHQTPIAYYVMLTGASFVGIGSLIALTIRAARNARRKRMELKKSKSSAQNKAVPSSVRSKEEPAEKTDSETAE